jgi:hypothetical protein
MSGQAGIENTNPKDAIFPFFSTPAFGNGKFVKSAAISSDFEIKRLNDSSWFVVAREGIWAI